VIVVDVCAPLPSVAYDSATPEDLAETVAQVEKLDRRTISGIVDVRDLDKLRAIVNAGVAELGQHGIRVNSVHPTGVATPMGSGGMQAEIGAAIAGRPARSAVTAGLSSGLRRSWPWNWRPTRGVVSVSRMGGPVEPASKERIERVINHRLQEVLGAGTAQRAVLLGHGDDPAIGPGQLMIRVFVPAPDDPADYEQALATWHEANQTAMDELRREVSLRLPSVRLLEFTIDDPGAATPRITVPDDGTLAAEQMSGREIVTTAMSLLRANYVFPEVAEQAAAAVEARMAAGEYDNLDEITLTDLVTSHLREITRDKHLALRLGGGPPPDRRPVPGGPEPAPGAPAPAPGAPQPVPTGPGPMPAGPRRMPGGPGPFPGGPGGPDNHEVRRLAMRQGGRMDNFGIRRVERLDGNIGYLDVRRVAVPANAGPAIAAAMELVAGTYALILDLRHNGGGSPEGVAFWCSYLFAEEEPTHLNDIFHTDSGETRQFWALPYVPGTRYVDRPVYALTSSHTFSGGEEFCYNLQALGRAELIGETTGGGAHPTRGFPVSAGVHISVPFARSINPVTGTNWEGTGVVPDVAVPEAEAYDVAYAKALRHVLALDDVPPPIKHEASDTLATLEAKS
jgi:Peptidase family S41/N-terminal domain of Peptidase_S41 in eukaryotic IRBP